MLIDEHLTWKEHITVIENKVSKNLGLLHRARGVLDSTAIKIMVRTKLLNINKLNIYQILNFMFEIKANTAPYIFQNQFTEIQHQYSTRFSKNSSVESQLVYSQKKFSVSSREPRLWNKLLDQQQKSLNRETSF